ncbi:hypothetical protein [Synechococcus sp. CBW1107]|uniref:hypothetical protein n=1 Tax=Synechococcus sp. CBW1107 TaxID=2789857 RepID=UPI002AD2DF75|nr:hypothetical protein [Synechococcus sp. CBW1107]CAK6693048.1 hypothetical protein IFHNHDMJ_01344 [Synechococcus sp. CBW1107]
MATTTPHTATPSGADPAPPRLQAWRLGAVPLLALLLPLELALQPGGVAAVEAQPGGGVAAPAPAATEPAPASDNGEAPGAREKALLEKIRSLKAPRWRVFGACRYDWAGWRLAEGNVRTTGVACGDPPVTGSVAVHCDTLKLTRRVGESPWETWRLPFSRGESTTLGGEDEMMANLCANVTPASTPATPPPAGQSAGTDNAAPRSAAPQTTTPKPAVPKTAAPKTSTPQPAAPKAAPPKTSAPKPAAP